MPAMIIKEICKHHGLTNFRIHIDGQGFRHRRCKQCRTDAVQKRRYTVKIKAIEYLGGKCNRCGYNKCPGALDFHHKDPNKKNFSISRNGVTRAWEKVKKEIEQCELICANCHREEHYDPRNMIRFIKTQD